MKEEPVLLYDAEGTPLPRQSRGFFREILPGITGIVLTIGITATVLSVQDYRDRQKRLAPDGQQVYITMLPQQAKRRNLDLQGPMAVTELSILDTEQLAANRWSEALRVQVDAPPLYWANMMLTCHTDQALACAGLLQNVIYLKRQEWENKDLMTVMLHEIGHLRGVPHIEDDPLMSPDYEFGGESQSVRFPTPFAVAIAKEVMRQKKEKR